MLSSWVIWEHLGARCIISFSKLQYVLKTIALHRKGMETCDMHWFVPKFNERVTFCVESCGLQWDVAEALMTFRLRLQAVSLALHFLGVPHDSEDYLGVLSAPQTSFVIVILE
jgi:hypothetical protein